MFNINLQNGDFTPFSMNNDLNTREDVRNTKTSTNQQGTYQRIKSRLIVRPVHQPNYTEPLQDAFYLQVGDLALVIFVIVAEDKTNLMTAMVHKRHINDWAEEMGTSTNAIFEAALRNTMVLYPPVLYLSIADVMNNDYVDLTPLWTGTAREKERLWQHLRHELHHNAQAILTTRRKLNGAISVFYPGMSSLLRDLFGEDFYVGFLSTGEAAVGSCSMIDFEQLQDTVQDLNRVVNFTKDVLSNQVFICDGLHLNVYNGSK